MSSLKWVVQLIPLILLICVCEAEQKLTTKECENLGFTGLALCSDCHTFAEYIKDQGECYFYIDFMQFDFSEILCPFTGFNSCRMIALSLFFFLIFSKNWDLIRCLNKFIWPNLFNLQSYFAARSEWNALKVLIFLTMSWIRDFGLFLDCLYWIHASVLCKLNSNWWWRCYYVEEYDSIRYLIFVKIFKFYCHDSLIFFPLSKK